MPGTLVPPTHTETNRPRVFPARCTPGTPPLVSFFPPRWPGSGGKGCVSPDTPQQPRERLCDAMAATGRGHQYRKARARPTIHGHDPQRGTTSPDSACNDWVLAAGGNGPRNGGVHTGGHFHLKPAVFARRARPQRVSTAKTDQALETFSQDRISRLNSSSSTRCARTSVRSRRSSLINREPSSRATSERSV